jgi:hypothetical protein
MLRNPLGDSEVVRYDDDEEVEEGFGFIGATGNRIRLRYAGNKMERWSSLCGRMSQFLSFFNRCFIKVFIGTSIA